MISDGIYAGSLEVSFLSDIDDGIAKKFLGLEHPEIMVSQCHSSTHTGTHLVPTVKMIPPCGNQMLREIDGKYLASLYERIVTYPTAHVAPLLTNVQLSAGQVFDSENLEGYNYEMIGGNHIQEKPTNLFVRIQYMVCMSFPYNCKSF